MLGLIIPNNNVLGKCLHASVGCTASDLLVQSVYNKPESRLGISEKFEVDAESVSLRAIIAVIDGLSIMHFTCSQVETCDINVVMIVKVMHFNNLI